MTIASMTNNKKNIHSQLNNFFNTLIVYKDYNGCHLPSVLASRYEHLRQPKWDIPSLTNLGSRGGGGYRKRMKGVDPQMRGRRQEV